MQHIARLLDIPGQTGPPSPAFVGSGVLSSRGISRCSRENRPLFHTGRVPGFAAPHRESTPGIIHRADESRSRKLYDSPNRLPNKRDSSNESKPRESSCNRLRSREGSPRMPRPKSEEIPLELIKKTGNSVVDVNSKINMLPRPQTPRTDVEPSTSRETQKQEATPTKISAETSFMDEEKVVTPKKSGVVEIV